MTTFSCFEDRHDWQDEYYGVSCRLCKAFYPYGSEPWAPDDDYEFFLQEELYGDEV